MSKNLYVYNLALRREDGKIEQDTVYREKLLTREEVERLGVQFSCSVIASCVGVYKPNNEQFIKDNTFVYELAKPKDLTKKEGEEDVANDNEKNN